MRNPTFLMSASSRTTGSSPLASMAASVSARRGWNETAACAASNHKSSAEAKYLYAVATEMRARSAASAIDGGWPSRTSSVAAWSNGRRVTFRIFHVFEFNDGVITREQVWLDTGAIVAQLTAG